MAQILGKSGRYVSGQVFERRWRILKIALALMVGAGFLVGFGLGGLLPHVPRVNTARNIILWLLLASLIAAIIWGGKEVNRLEREMKNYESGVQGEDAVSKGLAKFPNDFYVINDIKTESGNLDHVVIGPTGVFVIDAKNWRGIVSADGKGELTLNGNPTDKPECNNFVGRMMKFKERVDVLTGNKEIRFQALFVFTSAYVGKIWGKTGNVNCLGDYQLYKYIVEKGLGNRLKPEQVKSIARAFAQLAHMEKDFSDVA